jgi:hypothetical protein
MDLREGSAALVEATWELGQRNQLHWVTAGGHGCPLQPAHGELIKMKEEDEENSNWWMRTTSSGWATFCYYSCSPGTGYFCWIWDHTDSQ